MGYGKNKVLFFERTDLISGCLAFKLGLSMSN